MTMFTQNATGFPPSHAPASITLTNQLSAACNEIVELTERLRSINDRVSSGPRPVDGRPVEGQNKPVANVPSLASMAAALRTQIDVMRDEVARLDVSV